MAIRTAIIGLGIMGRRMLEHLEKHPGYSVTAIWDPDKDACGAALNFSPSATLVASADDAIQSADMVYLAKPTHWGLRELARQFSLRSHWA